MTTEFFYYKPLVARMIISIKKTFVLVPSTPQI